MFSNPNFVTVYQTLISRERSKIWKNCKSHYLLLLANLEDEPNLIFSYISCLTSMTSGLVTSYFRGIANMFVSNICCYFRVAVTFGGPLLWEFYGMLIKCFSLWRRAHAQLNVRFRFLLIVSAPTFLYFNNIFSVFVFNHL